MQHASRILLSAILAGLAGITLAFAAGTGLPGDRGRPGDGVPRPSGGPPRPPPGDARPAVRAPSIDVALQAAQAIAEACKQYPLGIAIVDAEGVAKLIYVPDGSEDWHGYSAVRKAYTAVTFKLPTSQLVTKAQQDPELAGRIKADPNLQAFSGGVPLLVGEEVIGAIGVSGAEPGGHDEECALHGVEKISKQLK